MDNLVWTPDHIIYPDKESYWFRFRKWFYHKFRQTIVDDSFMWTSTIRVGDYDLKLYLYVDFVPSDPEQHWTLVVEGEYPDEIWDNKEEFGSYFLYMKFGSYQFKTSYPSQFEDLLLNQTPGFFEQPPQEAVNTALSLLLDDFTKLEREAGTLKQEMSELINLNFKED